jgi:hypothetical protein
MLSMRLHLWIVRAGSFSAANALEEMLGARLLNRAMCRQTL